MKRRSSIRIIPAFLAGAAISCGFAHAEEVPAEGRDAVTFQPWISTLGVHFHSESLFEDTTTHAHAHAPGTRDAASALSDQASAAGLQGQGLGIGGEWRPFGNGFRLNFAMYLDSAEPDETDGFRARNLPGLGPASEDPISLRGDFEAVPYMGLGWQTHEGGLDVNLDVGAFLPGESLFGGDDCLDPDSPLTRCGASSLGNGRSLSGSFRKFEWYPVVSLGLEYRF